MRTAKNGCPTPCEKSISKRAGYFADGGAAGGRGDFAVARAAGVVSAAGIAAECVCHHRGWKRGGRGFGATARGGADWRGAGVVWNARAPNEGGGVGRQFAGRVCVGAKRAGESGGGARSRGSDAVCAGFFSGWCARVCGGFGKRCGGGD